MVAYGFKTRFAEPIVAGTKGGTIRGERKWRYGAGRHAGIGGHAFPGEELQLYTGMRTKHCLLIARKQCVAVERIMLNFAGMAIIFPDRDAIFYKNEDFDVFARFDGFSAWLELVAFWHETHGSDLISRGIFEGWHIRWLPLPWERV